MSYTVCLLCGKMNKPNGYTIRIPGIIVKAADIASPIPIVCEKCADKITVPKLLDSIFTKFGIPSVGIVSSTIQISTPLYKISITPTQQIMDILAKKRRKFVVIGYNIPYGELYLYYHGLVLTKEHLKSYKYEMFEGWKASVSSEVVYSWLLSNMLDPSVDDFNLATATLRIHTSIKNLAAGIKSLSSKQYLKSSSKIEITVR